MNEINRFKIFIGIIVGLLFIIIATLFGIYFKKNYIDNNVNNSDNTNEEVININNVSFIKKIDDYSLYCDKSKEDYSICFIKYNDNKYKASLILEKNNEFIFEFEINSKKYVFNSFDNIISNDYAIDELIENR